MRILAKMTISAMALLCLLALAGCGHKLVAPQGQKTVGVFPDQATYAQVAKMKKQGGVAGMLGGLGENFVVKKVENNTAVKIIETRPDGYQIEVTAGPNKGLKGFVPKESVD